MSARMTCLPRTHRFVFALILPLLAISLPSNGTAVRKAKPAPSAAVRASTAIIALPLNPVIPAGQRLCAARTPSGLGYTILRAGAGARPGQSDAVLVNYIGYLAATGAVFDQGMRSALSVDGVIPGFAQGLQMMTRASVVRFCIPAALGYGARATGPIPANADLVFQVELVDFKTAAELAAAAKTETPGAAPKP